MKILLCFLLFQYIYAQTGFGTSYLKNSILCQKWNCINSKLGLSDVLPPREQYAVVLKSLLPDGPWQSVVDKTLDGCYGNRTRRYTNTCPGQALAHCVVDQLIQNCPAESLNIKDGCSSVSAAAGMNYMFSLSRYSNLDENAAKDRRSEWFLKHFFSTKCCELPDMFDLSTLTQCGFTKMIQTYDHEPRLEDGNYFILHGSTFTTSTPKVVENIQSSDDTKVNIVDLNTLQTTTETLQDETRNMKWDLRGDTGFIYKIPVGKGPNIAMVHLDPLECCDVAEFIDPSFKEECHFEISWQGQNRLVIDNSTGLTTTEIPATTTESEWRPNEVSIRPHSCEEEECVFRQLKIVSETGSVDQEAYLKFLDNFTTAYPVWSKAKARVITTCLNKPLTEYDGDCEINKILACTFDVLTENCPSKVKNDTCKHNRNQSIKDHNLCQVSTSKSRPKNRRELCFIPNFVNTEILVSCKIHDIARTQYTMDVRVASTQKKSNFWINKYMCKTLTPSTTCLLNKMGVLNKYGFLDYFKMKDAIRQFTTKQPEWTSLQNAYLSAFMNMPLYTGHCNSAKKFLNVLDSMLLTCPTSKRKATPQCTKLFKQMTNTMPEKEKLDQIIKHFHHVFMPQEPESPYNGHVIQRKHVKKVLRNPPYNFGILNSHLAPPVKIIDVKPKVQLPEVKRPLVILPVYLRLPNDKRVLIRPLNNNGIWRSPPFSLHNQIAQARISSSIKYTTESSIEYSSISTKK